MLDAPLLTTLHVVISVVGIVTGLVVVGGLIAGSHMGLWTALFLLTTILTSVTGFLFFPLTPVLPSHVVGALSLIVLAVCLMARYRRHLQGRWRAAYVLTAVAAVYLNTFVLVTQLFIRTPALAQLAPTQREAPFAITQALILALFVWLGLEALRRFRPSLPGTFSSAAGLAPAGQ